MGAVTYVYAVSKAPVDAPIGRGVDGIPLRVVATDTLAAVVSDTTADPVPVKESALWAHERVVEQLMVKGAVLPMRFGSLVRDDSVVRDLLVERQEELIATLQRVKGAVELGVRLVGQPQPTADEGSTPGSLGPGTAYLLGRSRSLRWAGALAQRLDRAVAQLYRARVQHLLRSPSLPVTAAYLVDHTDVDVFRSRVTALATDVDGAQITCTGPWPPYSFTRGQGS